MIMELNTVFVCALVITVSGQFIDTEYRLDSAPLPIRRRVNDAQYEIQPSVGREIQYNPEPARVSNQGRRHIENNNRGNVQNDQNNINVSDNEPKLYVNIYQSDDRNIEIRPINRQINNNEKQPESSEQFNARLQENYNIQQNNGNNEYLHQNYGYDGANLKTNLNNPHNTHQGNSHNYPINNIVKTSENTGNQQNLNNQQSENSRASDNNETLNINRHTEASLRAIDSYSYSQQNIDSTNNRNYNTKPSRQNGETKKENRNFESIQTTEHTRKNTVYDKSVTEETKSTEDNELTSKSHAEGRIGNKDDEKWIWSSDGEKTTKSPFDASTPTVGDRAAFAGDKCPTGKVRFNNMCVDKD